MFDSEPEPNLNNRVMYQPRGKVLGGTSSINGMIYMRGNHADYDEWRQRGCEGWDFESVLPYFRKAEDNERGAERIPRRRRAAARLQPAIRVGDRQAAAGGLHPGRHSAQPGLQRRTAGRLRLLPDDDEQSPPLEHRRRLSAAGAQAAEPDRSQTNAHATRVLIENGRAVGVEFRTPRGPEDRARHAAR